MAAMLSGCVVIPAGKGTVIKGEEIKEEQLTFLDEPGTTEETVVAQLGQPDLIWPEARVYAYHWEINDGIAIWAIPAGYGAAVGSTGLSSSYVLLIQFGEDGGILRHESRERPTWDTYGEMIREWVAQPLETGDGS